MRLHGSILLYYSWRIVVGELEELCSMSDSVVSFPLSRFSVLTCANSYVQW